MSGCRNLSLDPNLALHFLSSDTLDVGTDLCEITSEVTPEKALLLQMVLTVVIALLMVTIAMVLIVNGMQATMLREVSSQLLWSGMLVIVNYNICTVFVVKTNF